MGQYFSAVSLDKNEYLYPHDFDNGAKLMESSYISNNYVEAAERLLSPGGAWHKTRIYWAGDYGEEENLVKILFLLSPKKDIENGKTYNIHSYTHEFGTKAVVGHEKLPSAYENPKLTASIIKKWLKTLPKKGRYLVNHTKKVCLDLNAEQGTGETWNDKKKTPIIIHPLPLLTSSGNGNGGGDYHGTNMAIVGSWAGDIISMEYKPMYTLNKPISFIEGDEEEGDYEFVSSDVENVEKDVKAATEVLKPAMSINSKKVKKSKVPEASEVSKVSKVSKPETPEVHEDKKWLAEIHEIYSKINA